MTHRYTVRLTRKQLIFIETLLHGATDDMLGGIAEGFNGEVDPDDRIETMTVAEAKRLANRLYRIEQDRP